MNLVVITQINVHQEHKHILKHKLHKTFGSSKKTKRGRVADTQEMASVRAVLGAALASDVFG